MTTALTTQNGGALAKFNREAIDTIKATVAKGATDAELEMFLHLASRYGLDPFAKEIWCTKYVKQGQDPAAVPATIIVSRDGYLKAAQQDPDFDGIASGVVKAGDKFAFNPVNGTVEHSFGAQRGAILGAWAVVHHKKRRPVACFAEFGEYKGNSPIWANYPSAMIQKVAEVQALKRQFGLSGIVSKEEMDYQPPEEVDGVTVIDAVATPAQIAAPAATNPEALSPWEKASKRLRAIVGKGAKITMVGAATYTDAMKEYIKATHGVESTKDLNPDQLNGLADAIEQEPSFLLAFDRVTIPAPDDMDNNEAILAVGGEE